MKPAEFDQQASHQQQTEINNSHYLKNKQRHIFLTCRSAVDDETILMTCNPDDINDVATVGRQTATMLG